MKHSLNSYKHIVDGKIETIHIPHPLEGFYDKKIFIKRFVRHFDGMKYEDISGGDNKLFKILYNGCSYNVYIEAFDGGGRDRSDGSKKISIPASKAFKRLTELGESVLIINEYVPLKHNEVGELVLEDISIYGIMKPKEIYSSKVIRENTGNPSSRWVSLEVMLKALNKSSLEMNKKDNVYVIRSDLISKYFDIKILDEQYEEMARYIYEVEKNDELSESKITRIFRDRLIKQRGMKCEFKNCKVCISDQLVASHINARANIRNSIELSKEAKFELMSDPNNGFLLCKQHDGIFDKKYITILNDGELIVAPKIRECESEYKIENYEGKKIIDVRKESIKYLDVHHTDFCKINKIDNFEELVELELKEKNNEKNYN